jgi:hypothetical protein
MAVSAALSRQRQPWRWQRAAVQGTCVFSLAPAASLCRGR